MEKCQNCRKSRIRGRKTKWGPCSPILDKTFQKDTLASSENVDQENLPMSEDETPAKNAKVEAEKKPMRKRCSGLGLI